MIDFRLPWSVDEDFDQPAFVLQSPERGKGLYDDPEPSPETIVALSEAFQEALELLEANYIERMNDALTYAVSDDTRNFLTKHKTARGVV